MASLRIPFDATKTCTSCGQEKPVGEFHSQKKGKWGVDSRCKPCRNADAVRRTKLLGRAHKNTIKRRHILKTRYGLTVEAYNALFAAQNGVCAICLLPEDGCSGPLRTKRVMAVDHDHETGKVRGLLCIRCNSAVERFDRMSDFADRVRAYLQKA